MVSAALVPLLDVLLCVVLFEIALFQAPDCLCLERHVDVPSSPRALPLQEAIRIDVTRGETLLDGVRIRLDEIGGRLAARRRSSTAPAVLVFADRHLPVGRVKATVAEATRARCRSIGLAVRQSTAQ